MESVKYWALLGSVIALTVLMLITLVRSIAGPRFTDRVVAEVHGYDGRINDYIYQLKR